MGPFNFQQIMAQNIYIRQIQYRNKQKTLIINTFNHANNSPVIYMTDIILIFNDSELLYYCITHKKGGEWKARIGYDTLHKNEVPTAEKNTLELPAYNSRETFQILMNPFYSG